MILDAGIALFYHAAVQTKGGMPSKDGVLFHRGWYGERTVGIQRYYTARQYDDRADVLIRILRPVRGIAFAPDDYAVLSDGKRYRILQVQFLRDEDAGADVCDLTLERMGGNDVGTDGS